MIACPVIAVLCLASLLSGPLSHAQGVCFEEPSRFNLDGAAIPVTAGDYDRDGDIDLATALRWTLMVYYNDGLGGFDSLREFSCGEVVWDMVTADFDNDGYPDIATANDGSDDLTVLLNDRAGGFPSIRSYASGLFPRSLAAGDIDNDLDVDLVVGDYEGHEVLIFENRLEMADTSFHLTASYSCDGGFVSSVLLPDVDRDGFVDLVATQCILGWLLVLNNQDGTFDTASATTHPPPPTHTDQQRATALDVNGDGFDDVIVPSGNGDDVVVWLNDPGGDFFDPIRYPASDGASELATGDFDLDGDPDLVVSGSELTILFNTGAGSFDAPVLLHAGLDPGFILTDDLDRDHLLDLATRTSEVYESLAVSVNCLGPVWTVTNLDDSGPGSLRAAIANSNLHGDSDTIQFVVSGTIQLLTPLPALSDDAGGTFIDGLSAPGASPGNPTIILDGSQLGAGAGITITSANNTVSGLAVRKFPGSGIEVLTDAAVSNTISGNLLYGNGGLSLDLNGDGVTINDPGDADIGPNDLLNYPVFDSIFESTITPGVFAVYGTAAPLSTVELFLSAEYGNLQRKEDAVHRHGPAYELLGTADADTIGLFAIEAITAPEWSLITATATDPSGNTSELARNKTLSVDPIRVTAYSDQVQILVIGPADSVGVRDSISFDMNTFGDLAVYDEATDYNDDDTLDNRITIASPDTGYYDVRYFLKPLAPPRDCLTGIGIDGHNEATASMSFVSSDDTLGTEHYHGPGCADLNADEVLDVVDVVALVDVVFRGAPPPQPPSLADINRDAILNVLDVVLLIDHVFRGGPLPDCY